MKSGVRLAWSHLGWRWASLGLAGSLAIAATGPGLVDDKTISWWYALRVPPGHSTNRVVFYAGMVALSVAWLGLGRRLRRSPGCRPAELVLVGALWCLPLLAGPALFSRDIYSYVAQGTIIEHGLSPYHYGPAILAHYHGTHVLDAVTPFWRHTTAPYGPLFLGLASVVVAIAGSHLVLAALLMRMIELAGLALLATFVPRLARALGADPCRATWLAVISPLVLLELIAAGHNDALMIGLLVAGVTFAIERRPLLGIAVCAVAATVKLPAAAGILFILVAWVRAEPASARRAISSASAVVLAVGAAVSLGTGLSFGWISGKVLSTPGRVRLAITPVTAVGHSLTSLQHELGIGASVNAIDSVLGVIALLLTGLLALALVYRTRYETLVPNLGLLLLVSVLTGPAAWPWYLTWGLALVACCASWQRSRSLPLVLAAVVFVVKPDGILALPREAAPYVLALYATAAFVLWRQHRRPGAARPASASTAGLPSEPLLPVSELTR